MLCMSMHTLVSRFSHIMFAYSVCYRYAFVVVREFDLIEALEEAVDDCRIIDSKLVKRLLKRLLRDQAILIRILQERAKVSLLEREP